MFDILTVSNSRITVYLSHEVLRMFLPTECHPLKIMPVVAPILNRHSNASYSNIKLRLQEKFCRIKC